MTVLRLGGLAFRHWHIRLGCVSSMRPASSSNAFRSVLELCCDDAAFKLQEEEHDKRDPFVADMPRKFKFYGVKRQCADLRFGSNCRVLDSCDGARTCAFVFGLSAFIIIFILKHGSSKNGIKLR